jgi:dsDNA-binding SOS-regulon protein
MQYGERPYSWIAENKEVVQQIMKGLTLPKPTNQYCPESLFQILLR